MNYIHSCGYHCDKPGCIKEQRDDLVKKFIVNARKPLTDKDIKGIVDVGLQTWTLGESTYEFARAIEQAHGIGGES